jgi:allophanate hydrolase subunit 1
MGFISLEVVCEREALNYYRSGERERSRLNHHTGTSVAALIVMHSLMEYGVVIICITAGFQLDPLVQVPNYQNQGVVNRKSVSGAAEEERV